MTELAAGVYELTDEEYFGPVLASTTLSSTGARELLKPGGPARYRHQADTGTVEVKREFDVGHAVHTLVLGSGPGLVRVDAEEWRSKAVKDEVAAIRAEGKVPLRSSDYDAAVAMTAAVRAHPIAAKLLSDDRTGGGWAERTLLWVDNDGVMCRAKVDWLRRDGMVDLKTTQDASADALSKSAHNYGYAIQAAFYARGFRAVDGPFGPDPFFVHIAVEKTPPYLVHVNQLTERAMAYGDRKVSEALQIYRDCSAAGVWPGYPDDEITDIDLPAWVRTEEY
jgi:hypothetical protein